ncbi:ribonuclease H [Senna tora]|uniref:Ribonuclease H n=1 Tax=Senna tora TaxID=362788 RepID=A0A834SG25_9FABA|nr:ribonuclease H [Senna tora]
MLIRVAIGALCMRLPAGLFGSNATMFQNNKDDATKLISQIMSYFSNYQESKTLSNLVQAPAGRMIIVDGSWVLPRILAVVMLSLQKFGGCIVSHPLYLLVNDIRNLLAKDWEVKLAHTFREGNRVADAIANFAQKLPFGDIVLDHPPSICNIPLHDDIKRVGLPCKIAY